MATFRFLLAVSVCCMLALISCSQDSTIVGKWRRGKYSVEIFEDGRIMTTDASMKKPSEGTYKFIKDDIIRLEFEGSKPEEFKISFSRGKLILTSPDGKTHAVYRRARSFTLF